MFGLMLALPLAAAGPATHSVALKCQVSEKEWVFNLNEGNQTVTYVTTETRTIPAMFTPEEVVIVPSNDRILFAEWRINRSDLSIRQTLAYGSKAPKIDMGTCQIFTPPKRQF